MLFWTHLVFGLFCLMLFVGRVNNWVGFLLLGLVGAVFLDIDSYTSRIGRNGFSRVLMAFNSHRGMVHSLIFVFFLYFVLELIFGQIALGFLIGALSHLFLDCFTRRGVRLFFPFKFRVKGFMRSGGFFEIILFLVFLVLDVFLIMAYLVSGL
jgi:inner membrane protein